MFWDEGDDASKEETDDVLTDADQGGPEDAIEEDKNNSQNVSDQRKNSDTSDEVGSWRDRRQVKIIIELEKANLETPGWLIWKSGYNYEHDF